VTTAAPPSRARDEAVTRLGASFKRAMVAVRRLRGRETHRPGAPSFAQYQLLFALDDRDDLSAGELAAAADLSPATVSHMLDSLVELGFVTRDRSTHDRRVVTCSLTAEGRKLIAQRRALFESRWADALGDVRTADLAAAAEVFDRIAAMFDDFDADA
jgi:MarR family transcriptional regulator, organic hydroperoxide resistance regulator